ncbi:tetratricopeptide repeat protein [Desulfovibrio sp. OttesenSCG-928-F07]|nr:tetratricopeptide repeat protein [Desulfovibrio sp. OttesenSCG-928-F07]
MSKGLFDARRKISAVGGLLRQNNVINAVQSLHNGLQDMLRENLLKSERDEFERLLTDAVRAVSSNAKIREAFQMTLTYTPGDEAGLLANIRILLDTLEQLALDEAEKRFMELEAAKQRRFEEGVTALGAGNTEKAKEIFNALAGEYGTDITLLVNIAEAYEQAGLLEDAAFFLEKASAGDPQSAYIHNKRGILYRKMKRFEDSEQAFISALAITPDDPYIYFNSGRLYVDWQKWPEAQKAGSKALELEPEFNEAKMLAEYAAKRVN